VNTQQAPAAADYLDSEDLERLTGTKASTWRYWAMIDQEAKSEEERVGPPSFKLGRRRVWKRSVVMAWLAEREMTGAGVAGGARG
jgi:prophage regulatory protein